MVNDDETDDTDDYKTDWPKDRTLKETAQEADRKYCDHFEQIKKVIHDSANWQ